jgi:hypothetical protein
MLNASQVWTRLKALPAFKTMSEADFRPIVYIQTFTPPAGGIPTSNNPQTFPGGAVILGITGSAFVPGVGPAGQAGRNRQLFQVDFAFSNNEAITPGGPILADALFGGGESDIFPSREYIVAPNQLINCRVANITTGLLTVQIAYHCLVYRFAT